tara:strand:- start:780 stop:1076 length:297 start_codon:yes stop_codon:yes gene_type:complete
LGPGSSPGVGKIKTTLFFLKIKLTRQIILRGNTRKTMYPKNFYLLAAAAVFKSTILINFSKFKISLLFMISALPYLKPYWRYFSNNTTTVVDIFISNF